MDEMNLATRSIYKWVFDDNSRLAWYARYCKKRGLTYRGFVEELEVSRRDILKTPDGVLMNPECNDDIDMVRITLAWKALCVKGMGHLFARP